MTASPTAPSEVHVGVDDEALALATPQLSEVLLRLSAATEALGALFATLASEPTQYEALREDLGRLTRDRRLALERVGQLAAGVFVVRPVENAAPPVSRVLPFECSTVTWVPHDRPRLMKALLERAAQRGIDVILVNKLVSLDETTALARASAAPVIDVRLGYDVINVKTALEEHFGKHAS